MKQNPPRPTGRRFAVRFTNGLWVVLDRITYNHRAFKLVKLAHEEAELQNSKGLPW